MTLEERIGYQFKNKKYLRRALTHSSYSNESKEKPESNERMEFWGTPSFPWWSPIISSTGSTWTRGT